MTTRYRDATAADIPAVDALFRTSFIATFGHLYAAEDLAAFLGGFSAGAWAAELTQADVKVRLAEVDGTAVGFAKVGDITLPVTPSGPALELRQLYLTEAAKGTGIAAVLMEWALAEARARGAGELFLSVYIDNHRARRFYERHGFTDIGPYRFMVGNHADEDRLMRLVL